MWQESDSPGFKIIKWHELVTAQMRIAELEEEVVKLKKVIARQEEELKKLDLRIARLEQGRALVDQAWEQEDILRYFNQRLVFALRRRIRRL